MGADGEVKILFRTEAQLQGAEQTQRAIAEVAKQSTGAAKGAQELGRQAKGAVEATGKLGEANFKLSDALKGLAFEFPLLARAIHLATSPLSLLVAAFSAGINAILNANAVIAESIARWDALGKAIAKASDSSLALDKLKEAIVEFNKATEKAAEAPDPIAEKLQRQLALIQAINEANKKLAGVQEKAGLPSTPEGKLDRDAANQKAAALLKAEKQYRQQQAAAREKLPGAVAEQSEAERQIEAAKARMTFAQGEVEAAKKDMGTSGVWWVDLGKYVGLPVESEGTKQQKRARLSTAQGMLSAAQKQMEEAQRAQKGAAGRVADITAESTQGAEGERRARTERYQFLEQLGAANSTQEQIDRIQKWKRQRDDQVTHGYTPAAARFDPRQDAVNWSPNDEDARQAMINEWGGNRSSQVDRLLDKATKNFGNSSNSVTEFIGAVDQLIQAYSLMDTRLPSMISQINILKAKQQRLEGMVENMR